MKSTDNRKVLQHLPDAAPLMKVQALPGDQVLLYRPWLEHQGQYMVEHAVKHGRLTPEQADSVDYLYIPQADGSLFCAVVIDDTPGLILGTCLPPGAWTMAS